MGEYIMKQRFCFSVLLFIITIRVFPSYSANVFIDPSQQEIKSVGDRLVVGVSIDDVEDLFAYQFTLVFDPEVLDFAGIREGDFLKDDGTETFPMIRSGDDDSDAVKFGETNFNIINSIKQTGIINILNTRLGSNSGVSGTGSIIDLQFKLKDTENCSVKLQDVILANSDDAQLIPFNIQNGEILYSPDLPSVIKEYSDGSPMLVLQADYQNTPGSVYVDVWIGEMEIKTGQFLEYQMIMFSGNPSFQGSVELHTSDGSNLNLSESVDQNGISTSPESDLSNYARDNWYHRKISLDALAGKVLKGITIATASQDNLDGIFRLYVDNIQITDGEYILKSIYIDDSFVPVTGTNESTETTFFDAEGVVDYRVSIVGTTNINPKRNTMISWGKIKSFK
ncbi:hypothetical protein GF312_17700 [Candidatus Poribacteria bacterium]|nr:hypothetical protein [Candidatus Poribacteria bacterium]